MDSDSLTPPLSPGEFMLEEEDLVAVEMDVDTEDNKQATCFHCLGQVNAKEDSFHSEGYLNSHHMDTLLKEAENGLRSGAVAAPSSVCDMLDVTEVHRMSNHIRQLIGTIQTMAVKPSSSFLTESSVDAFGKRGQVNDYIHNLIVFVHSNKDIGEDVLEAVVSCLHSILLYMGRVSDVPPPSGEVIRTRESNCGVPHQAFHLHLDLYWRLVCLANSIQVFHPGFRYSHAVCSTPDVGLDMGLFDQVVHLVIWDLVYLAVLQRAKSTTVMYPCTCVKELWTLILNLCEWRSLHNAGEVGSSAFWVTLHHVIWSLTETSHEEISDVDSRLITNPPEGLKVDNATEFCLNLIYNIAPLYDVCSTIQKVNQSNYHDLQSLLKKYLSSSSVTEAGLRHHLRTCLWITRQWEPNTGILITLWDYFYKRLNDTERFRAKSSLITGLACIQQTVASCFEACSKLATSAESKENDCSYHLFLRILNQHLGRLYQQGSVQEWKQIKGRIYSKFHQRRIQELLEGGLHNLTCLFVTLAITTDRDDVASKLCDFYDMLNIEHITFAKRSVIWRGAFTMMLVFEQQKADISFLVDRMTLAFTSAVSELKAAGLDTRHSVWKLILIYMEGTQEVIDSSPGLDNSEHKLICDSVKPLLTTCSDSELRTVLSSLQSIISRFRNVCCKGVNDDTNGSVSSQVHLQHLDFASCLWRTVYGFVSDHAQTLTPPSQVADLAAEFCLIALVFPPGEILGHRHTFVSVFQHFAAGEKTHVSISCRFLCHLLSSGKVLSQLQADLDGHESFVIRAWYRCCLQMPCASQQLLEVTRSVLQLVPVRDIFEQADISPNDALENVPILFLKAIEVVHSKTQVWREKMDFQRQLTPYFRDVYKHVAPVVRNLGPADTLLHVYRMMGHLVKYCARLLYHEPDVIRAVINNLVVPPHVMNPEKPVSPALLSVLRETLPLFVEGLGKLSYEKDGYVKTKLSDIVTVFLPKFSLRGSSAQLSLSSASPIHPVVASLGVSFTQRPTEESVKLRQFVLQLVISNFITVRNMAVHPKHNMGFSFLLEVEQRTRDDRVKARDVAPVLRVCLEYLLLVPKHSPLIASLVAILQHICTTDTGRFVSDAQPICEKFIKDYIVYNSSGVIRIMEKLAVLQQDVVISVIQTLSESVMNMERKRGVGVDTKLREQLFTLLRMLGNRGEEAIQQLKSSGHRLKDPT